MALGWLIRSLVEAGRAGGELLGCGSPSGLLTGTGADGQGALAWGAVAVAGSGTDACFALPTWSVQDGGGGEGRWWKDGGGWGWPTRTLWATVTESVLWTTVAARGWERGGDGSSAGSQTPLDSRGDA